MTIDRTYSIFYSAIVSCSRTAVPTVSFLGSISAM